MSVIGVRGLVVSNTELSDTAGTPPQAGVDLEPDVNGNELTGIEFDNVTASGNAGRGFQFSLTNVPTQPVQAVLRNCRVVGGGMYGFSLSVSDGRFGKIAEGSSISVTDFVTTDTGSTGILVESAPAELKLTFANTKISNASFAGGNAPVWIEGNDSPTVGVAFENVTVVDLVKRPAVKLHGTVQGLTGQIGIINPTGCVPVDVAGNPNIDVTCHSTK